MKYLKRFNEANKYQEQENANTSLTLKDICIELEDKGYTIKINYYPIQVAYQDKSLYKYKGVLYISKLNDIGYELPIDINDVKETIDRIKEFLGDRWIRMDRIFNQADEDEEYDLDEIFQILIEFKNNR